MPVLQYFGWVGSFLLAALLPKLVVSRTGRLHVNV